MQPSSEITFSCPNCRQLLACEEHLSGSAIACPACRETIVAPATAQPFNASTLALSPERPVPHPSDNSTAPPSGHRSTLGKRLAPVGILAVILAKSKTLLLMALKFFPLLLKTGGTMMLTIWAYAQSMGWPFAAGFVLLILVHECGHLIAAKRLGLKVGAPVFIPFMGAFIALKEAPRNAWIEAQVGIGGPILGSLGAALCLAVSLFTGSQLFAGLAYSGFFLNLFNLAPIGFLDGGRVATALSPWLWLAGLAVVLFLLLGHPNFLLGLILVLSLPRIFSLFRTKTREQERYFEVTTQQRWIIGSLYFGLIICLFLGMELIH